jgi:serine/threonine protein kinase
MLSPGTIVDGRFEIIDFLGEGGMGSVYSARQTAIGRTVALKLLKSNLIQEEEKVARFRNEARVLSGLAHPNIVGIHAVGVAETGQPYMAMDIVKGDTISDIIRTKGPFKADEAIHICIQICDALQYAHERQIIHRDIKPSNIVLTESGEDGNVKLVDFGIAKILDSTGQKLTRTGMAVGSVFYLSPGQLEGRAPDPTSDIYSLGCTLYEMLAGVPPFRGDSALETAIMHQQEEVKPIKTKNPSADVSTGLQNIIDRMMRKESKDRYESAQQVRDDFQKVLEGKPILAAPKGNPNLRKKVSGKLSTAFICAAAVVTVIVGGVIVAGKRETPPPADVKMLAETKLSETVRLHSRFRRGDKQGPRAAAPVAEEAVRLARQSGDRLLLSNALLEYGGILCVGYLNPETPRQRSLLEQAKPALLEARQVAAEEMRATTDASRRAKLHQLRMSAQTCLFILPTYSGQFPARADAQLALDFFKESQPQLTVHGIEDFNHTLRVAATVYTRAPESEPQLVEWLNLRLELLKHLGYDQLELEQDLLSIFSEVGPEQRPAAFAKARTVYGLK